MPCVTAGFCDCMQPRPSSRRLHPAQQSARVEKQRRCAAQRSLTSWQRWKSAGFLATTLQTRAPPGERLTNISSRCLSSWTPHSPAVLSRVQRLTVCRRIPVQSKSAGRQAWKLCQPSTVMVRCRCLCSFNPIELRTWHALRALYYCLLSTICGDTCPLSCVKCWGLQLAQCTRPQGQGS